MEDYKLRDLRASHTLGPVTGLVVSFVFPSKNVFFYSLFCPLGRAPTQWEARCAWRDWKLCLDTEI